MMDQTLQANTTQDNTMLKAAPQMNSQGELITQSQSMDLQLGSFDDVVSLGDTPLAISQDSLCPPTDDTGMEHKIISCGHVLKSTHDLARWSEKTGARRVNGIESLDAVSDLAINLEPNRTGRRQQGANDGGANESGNNRRGGRRQQGSADPTDGVSTLFGEGGNGNGRGGRRGQQKWKPVEGDVKSEVINCWPVLKSTHDQAQLSEKRGRAAVNQAGASELLDEMASSGQQGGQLQGGQQGSTVVQSWPVLKSTHDMATWSEKRGANEVNKGSGSQMLEEVIQNQGPAMQAGGSLQSGLDTQGGSHVQDSQGASEKPEKVMEDIHVHV